MGSLFTGRRKQFIEKFFERHRRKLLQFDGAELADCTAAKLAVTFQVFSGRDALVCEPIGEERRERARIFGDGRAGLVLGNGSP